MSERHRPGKFLDTRKAFTVHPDMQTFFEQYGQGMTFEEVRKLRDEMLANGEPYWQTDHDPEMKETAEERTKVAAARGWRWPRK
jgi:hypothetical protein